MKTYLFSIVLIACTSLHCMNSRLKNWGPKLALSAELNDYEDVKKRLDSGVEVDQADKDGMTAFLVACDLGFQDIALLLLEGGADPTFKLDDWPSSPLHKAIEKHQLKVCDALLKNVSLLKLPKYERDSYKRLAMVLWCLSSENSPSWVPREVMLNILRSSDELRVDVVKVVLSNGTCSFEQKLQVTKSIIGKDALCRVLSRVCWPHYKEYFSQKGWVDSHTAPEYAQKIHEDLRRPVPDGNWSEEYKEQHGAVYQLLRQDTFQERLPGLIEKWFFTSSSN